MAKRSLRTLVCVFGAGLSFVSPEGACDLPPGDTATVASVVDGETLPLTDGRKVRLLGAKAPAAPLGWKGEDPWPFVAKSKQALDRMTSGPRSSFASMRAARTGTAMTRRISL